MIILVRPAAAAVGSIAGGSAAMGKVLVVEDEPSSRRALVSLLKLNGFEAICAASLTSAIELLNDRPRWVLLDLMLPDGNGARVVEFIRDHSLPIRVAITTGASNWQLLLKNNTTPPDKVFIKPLDLDGVIAWLSSEQ